MAIICDVCEKKARFKPSGSLSAFDWLTHSNNEDGFIVADTGDGLASSLCRNCFSDIYEECTGEQEIKDAQNIIRADS